MEKYSKIKIGSNRSFGLVFFVVFLIIGLWPLKNGSSINFWLIGISHSICGERLHPAGKLPVCFCFILLISVNVIPG